MKKRSLFELLCQNRMLLNAWKQIRQKGASGGIDGMSIHNFEEHLDIRLDELKQELQAREWLPQPYLRITIPKKENERRELGLLSIKDKIVQQAIKMLIEQRFENLFLPNSYGYRPGKGHTKAVRFAKTCCQHKSYLYVLRLDIDNYFDTIDHELLFKRLHPLIPDAEVFRLVELCVKMGMVDSRMKWKEITKGVPQGAVLSPLLANFYLHPFDQFVLSRTKMYVRYADDFIILCKSREEADRLLQECSDFLQNRLKLKLNVPIISEVKDGVEFLGILIDNRGLSLSESKRAKLNERISALRWKDRHFEKEGMEQVKGISRYYAPLLPQDYLLELDNVFLKQLTWIVQNQTSEIPNKSTLLAALKEISFFSDDYLLRKTQIRNELVNQFLLKQSVGVKQKDSQTNKKLIAKRKLEYRQKESEASELVLSTYGTFVGVSHKGLTIRVKGEKQPLSTSLNLQHITVIGDGISLSSNALAFCMQRNIGVDYFTHTGKHYASLLSPKYLQASLWEKQVAMSVNQKSELAVGIIGGKIKNQMSLLKYFHKYHKGKSEILRQKFDEVIPAMKALVQGLKHIIGDDDYRMKLIASEARAAELYWGYVKMLLHDDDVEFEKRHRQGATDLVNCLLNYGYAILYARIWQLVLARKLNPMLGIIHVPQSGKPTLVFDVVELFRTQVVDRVVISLIQKKEPLVMQNGALDKETRQLLVRNISERIYRYEKFRNQECRLIDVMDKQVKEMADYIEVNAKFKPYVAKW